MKAVLYRLSTPLLLVLLAGCVSSGEIRNVEQGSSLPPPDTTNAIGAYEGTSEYRLGANDQVEITIFGVEELTKTVRINSNGQISLPLIGSVPVGGMTIPELETELTRRYAASYLQDPQVTVYVKEFASQRITFEGAIKQPGIYPLTGKTTLLQGIATAKGLDTLADMGGVVLFREVDGKKMAAVYDIRDLRSGRVEDPQLYGDDIVVIEQSGSKTALRRFIESVPAIGFFLTPF
ncbi:polysaccharide biosynthesis/export family protein [Pseudoxanthomonas koreensis]|uniref:polysaccharide biosynthesis/export family protein n=1 Tax=Pseudoxanthomonas koreensis TaxID=266061 RepID=UPI001390833F|nr:polysaccharide biosynthesis/export family protein [Pseudoxanthomonas koreensis]